MTLLEQYLDYMNRPFMDQWIYTQPVYKSEQDKADAAVYERLRSAQTAAATKAAKDGKRVRYIKFLPQRRETIVEGVIKRTETQLHGKQSHFIVHMTNGDRVNGRLIEDADNPPPALEVTNEEGSDRVRADHAAEQNG